MEIKEALSLIYDGILPSLQENGFAPAKPDGAKNGEAPLQQSGEHQYFDFTGDKGKIRVEAFGNQLLLFFSESSDASSDEDLKKESASYFNAEEIDQKDIKSLCNEITESVTAKFGTVSESKSKKLPTPVSKSAAKSGALAYDANTLANRICTLYPSLKEEYRANFERYGEFLAEEFFTEHANALIIETIRSGKKQEVNKLFKILNDIYENGSNDTQSLVAVTILGEMNNDQELIATASEYMCDDMKEPVILVNRFLASSGGKRMSEKLKNPPPYKPKKKKKKQGLMAQMMGGGGDMPQN